MITELKGRGVDEHTWEKSTSCLDYCPTSIFGMLPCFDALKMSWVNQENASSDPDISVPGSSIIPLLLQKRKSYIIIHHHRRQRHCGGGNAHHYRIAYHYRHCCRSDGFVKETFSLKARNLKKTLMSSILSLPQRAALAEWENRSIARTVTEEWGNTLF